MSRRIEIELTSSRPDGTWTWRAAGAREPRGILQGSLLHQGAKPGDVVRAEAEFEIDGITITSVLPPKTENRPEVQRIEVLGPARGDTPAVTAHLAGPPARRRGRSNRGRPDRPDHPRPSCDTGRERRKQAPEREAAGRAGKPGRSHPARTPHLDRPSSGSEAPSSEEVPARPVDRGLTGSHGRRPSAQVKADRPAEKRARRLNPGRTHRLAVLDSLPPEQKPIAEQVLRGGIPAVRTALHLEREKALAEGRPTPNAEGIIAIAEELLPRLKAAEWRDRAEAAAKDPDAVSLRDLRSIVAGGDVARDEESRSLAVTLREALERRVATLHGQWHDEIARLLDDNRVARALRLSTRPPEPLAKLSASLSQRLSEVAGKAMNPDTAPDRWLALLEAAAASPVCRSVRPAGFPPNSGTDLRQAAYRLSGRIPALATMLGVALPPPPIPASSTVRRPGSRARHSRPSGDRRAETGTSVTLHEFDDASGPPADAVGRPVGDPVRSPAAPPSGETPPAAGPSAEGPEDSVVVEEFGEPLGEPEAGKLG